MTQFAMTVILGVAAWCTFVLQGKQWPTFILATLFGIFLGTSEIGGSLRELGVWLFKTAEGAFG